MDCTLAPTMRAMIYNSITQNPQPTSMICNFGMCTMMGAIWLQSPHTKDLNTADPKGLAARYSTVLVFLDRFLVEASVDRRGAE